ncbi:MAG: hypothetical protein RLZZ432_254 [Chloroflexota bacterium]
MPIDALLLLAASAGVHAAWNIRLKGSHDPETAAMIAVITPGIFAGVAILAAAAVGAIELPAPYLLLSAFAGVAELLYFVTLAKAYARAPISVVYPIVRGLNPLLAVLVGVGLLRETLLGAQPYGIALIVAGLIALRPPWRALGGGIDPRGVAVAVAAGALSAVGSAIESVGVRGGGAVTMLCLTWGVTGLLYLALARRRATSPRPTPARALTGVLIIGGHFLVMAAFAVAPLSLVIPFRESAILLVSGWGLLRAREAVRPIDLALRAGGALAIVGGALLIALG